MCELKQMKTGHKYDRGQIRTQSNKMQAVSLIPNSYFVLKTPLGYAHFFLEVD